MHVENIYTRYNCRIRPIDPVSSSYTNISLDFLRQSGLGYCTVKLDCPLLQYITHFLVERRQFPAPIKPKLSWEWVLTQGHPNCVHRPTRLSTFLALRSFRSASEEEQEHCRTRTNRKKGYGVKALSDEAVHERFRLRTAMLQRRIWVSE